MAKAGIIIEVWKREIFEKHITKAGYTCEWFPGLPEGLGVLKVTLQRPTEAAMLHPIIKAAVEEAARTGAPK